MALSAVENIHAPHLVVRKYLYGSLCAIDVPIQLIFAGFVHMCQWRGMIEQMRWLKPPLFVLLLLVPSRLGTFFPPSDLPFRLLGRADGGL